MTHKTGWAYTYIDIIPELEKVAGTGTFRMHGTEKCHCIKVEDLTWRRGAWWIRRGGMINYTPVYDRVPTPWT